MDEAQNKKELPSIVVKSFAFTNPGGGTGLSDSKHNEALGVAVSVQIVKGWVDYETGVRFIGKSADPLLDDYLNKVAGEQDRRVFFGQFDILASTSDATAYRLLTQLADCCEAASDGTSTFFKQADGSWSDGTSSFKSSADLLECIEGIQFDAGLKLSGIAESLDLMPRPQ